MKENEGECRDCFIDSEVFSPICRHPLCQREHPLHGVFMEEDTLACCHIKFRCSNEVAILNTVSILLNMGLITEEQYKEVME